MGQFSFSLKLGIFERTVTVSAMKKAPLAFI